jgi:hypothetical protein
LLGFVVSSLAFFRVHALPDLIFFPLARRWQDLERRARERYDALDRLDADLNWYRGQYNAPDALVEVLRSPDRWLVYRAEALLDHPPEQDARGAGDVAVVEMVMTALVERDDALRSAHEDLAGARSVAVSWEAEVASARAQLQQDRAALERARAWQRQAEEKAKEAEGLRRPWRARPPRSPWRRSSSVRKGLRASRRRPSSSKSRLLSPRPGTALDWECLTREEALGRLQQEHTALEGVQAALKQREDEVSRLNGELVQISISHEDLRQSLEEQEAIVRDLQRQAEEARKSLEGEKKQVEGELTFVRFLLVNLSFGDSLPTLFFFVRGFQTCGPPWGTRPPRLRPCRRPTTPLNRS